LEALKASSNCHQPQEFPRLYQYDVLQIRTLFNLLGIIKIAVLQV